MKKGGYKIIDFKGTALSGTAVDMPGIYDQIVDDYDKPVMVSGVSLNGDIMDDAYASVQEKIAGNLSKSVELTVYGGIITVTEDDKVSFVVSKTTAELTAEIGDLEGLETTDKDSIVDALNEVNTKIPTSSEWISTTPIDNNTVRYKKYGDIVTVKRGVTGTAPANENTVIAKLPEDIKPSGTMQFLIDNGLYVIIKDDGDVVIKTPTANYIPAFGITYII